MPKEIIHPAQSDNLVDVRWGRDSGVVQVATDNPQAPSTGWFADLDRAGVNQLIQVLRRARDQAFGADA